MIQYKNKNIKRYKINIEIKYVGSFSIRHTGCVDVQT